MRWCECFFVSCVWARLCFCLDGGHFVSEEMTTSTYKWRCCFRTKFHISVSFSISVPVFGVRFVKTTKSVKCVSCYISKSDMYSHNKCEKWWRTWWCNLEKRINIYLIWPRQGFFNPVLLKLLFGCVERKNGIISKQWLYYHNDTKHNPINLISKSTFLKKIIFSPLHFLSVDAVFHDNE